MGERLDSALLCVTSGVKLKYEAKAKKPVSKDAVAELKRQMTKVKPESNAKIQGHGAQVKGQSEEIEKLRADLEKKGQDLEKKKNDFPQMKSESFSKIKELESKIEEMVEELCEKEEALSTLKAQCGEKEVTVNRLEEELDYKNRQPASNEMEVESHKKTSEEKIIQLEAKVKEFEGKGQGPSSIY